MKYSMSWETGVDNFVTAVMRILAILTVMRWMFQKILRCLYMDFAVLFAHKYDVFRL